MTKAILGSGIQVEYQDSATWYTAPEPVDIGNVGDVGSFVDVTHLASPNKTREYIAGLRDTEEKTMSFRFIDDDADQTRLRGLADNGATVPFRITFPATVDNGTQARATFSMVLSSQQVESPSPDGVLNLMIMGRVTGTTTWSTV
jgi:hypothetical protein